MSKIFVIRDSETGNFVTKYAIQKINGKYQYISCKVFAQESRGYISKQSAELALEELNEDIARYNIANLSFHVEECEGMQLVIDCKNFIGEYFVVEEIEGIEYVFVIKDKDNNYVHKTCLFKQKREVHYCPSKNLIDGCRYFRNHQIALEHLKELNEKNDKYKFNQKFKIEKIDLDVAISIELAENIGQVEA